MGKKGSVSFATVTVLFCMNFRSDLRNSVPRKMKKILTEEGGSEAGKSEVEIDDGEVDDLEVECDSNASKSEGKELDKEVCKPKFSSLVLKSLL